VYTVEKKMVLLTGKPELAESAILESAIINNLRRLGL